jgi:outer membrane protein OmpA-like peptidoglycan-associated protein
MMLVLHVPGLPEYNGCPKKAKVTKELKDILFDFNKATIKQILSKLDAAAKSLKVLKLRTYSWSHRC